MKKRWQTCRFDQSGAMAVMMALVIVVLLTVAAIAVDYGYMAWVTGELQKAADAGALAGARELVPYTGTPPAPNWTLGRTTASQTVLLNRADAQFLTGCDVTLGYFSLTTRTLDQNTGKTPSATEVPAIRVGIAKSAGHNGGPLRMMFAPIFGVSTFSLGVQATAMVSFPAGMPAGTLFPLAAAETIVNQYWTRNPPVSFQIGSGSSNGQWTSFKVNSSSASYISGLVSGGNPTSLNLNNNIYIQTGVQSSNYGNAASRVGQTVVIALVNANMTKNSSTPVLGFVAFKIEAVNQSSKYIQGHFDKDFNITNAAGVGPPTSGTLSSPNPPKLVN
jgi:hypothetical protein